jgi:hypothetical protein
LIAAATSDNVYYVALSGTWGRALELPIPPLFDALPDPKAVTALELKFKEAPIFVAEYQGQTLSFKKTPASDPAAFIAAELKRLAANP